MAIKKGCHVKVVPLVSEAALLPLVSDSLARERDERISSESYCLFWRFNNLPISNSLPSKGCG